MLCKNYFIFIEAGGMDINFVNGKKNGLPLNLYPKFIEIFKYKDYIINISVCFFIYILTFSFFHFLKNNTLTLDIISTRLLGIFIISVIIGAVVSKKFKLTKQDNAEKAIKNLYLSLIFGLCAFIILLFIFNIHFIIPNYILGALFCGLVIEAIYFMKLYKFKKINLSFIEYKKSSIKYLLLDGVILTFFCYFEFRTNLLLNNFKEQELLLLLIIFISWLISAATTHKFIPQIISNNRWSAFELQTKFYMRIIVLIILSMIFMQIEFSSALNIIKVLVGYSLVSLLFFTYFFAEKIKNKSDEPTVVFLKAYEIKDSLVRSNNKRLDGKFSFINTGTTESIAREKIGFEYLKNFGEVFSVLDSMLDLKSFDSRKTLIIKSDEPNDISLRQPKSYQLVVNLHVLNDQINLNNYLLDVRKTLFDGGVFVGALLPHHYRYKRYINEHSFWVGNILYFFDFIWKRVFPKLPITREIYTAFSKEKDRAISLAEGLGRLVYCGFNILDLAVVDDVVYFASVKNRGLVPEKKFFYSPIFKMKRIGQYGKEINVYKLRTMYPYAEFLQDYILKVNGYSKIGKPALDFRLPVWGKIFRKYWLDEIPQLLNLIKGEMKLVGVRPLSKTVYKEYPSDIKELRNKFKPGCIPPYVSLLMQGMDESVEAERIYLKEREGHPYKTDIKYFSKAIYNILTNKIRSA